jgi:hypothetical protein
MKMLLPSFNVVGENGMRDMIFTYSYLTKVKQNFFLFPGNLTDFARRAPLNYRLQGGVAAGSQPASVNSRTPSY